MGRFRVDHQRPSPTEPAGYAPSELVGLAEDAIEHAAADEKDVTLAFDGATGLPTQINLTRVAVDDGDFSVSAR